MGPLSSILEQEEVQIKMVEELWDASDAMDGIFRELHCQSETEKVGQRYTKCTCIQHASKEREKFEQMVTLLHTELRLQGGIEEQIKYIQSFHVDPYRTKHNYSYELPILKKEENCRYSSDEVIPLCCNAVRKIVR